MIREPRIPMFDLVMCLSDAMDLISPEVANHHKRVAYIARAIGAAVGLSVEQQRELVLAGAVHDMGALSLVQRINALDFEYQFEAGEFVDHPEVGYRLLRTFEPLAGAAALVRLHHRPWSGGASSEFHGEPVPTSGSILHLADRVVVLVDHRADILGQAGGITERIVKESGRLFRPDLVEAFTALAAKEFFWLDVVSPSITAILRNSVSAETIELGPDDLLSLATLFSKVIDFRSPFTASHSCGVAATAAALARFAGFSERERRMMLVAGYLHDLGKLAVSAEILVKPARLTEDERNIIRGHTYHTFRILEQIRDLDTINAWASLHHERLDGSGYPFHLSGTDLSVGSRIMAVADVFTALREDRPYRKGMLENDALQLLDRLAEASSLDSNIVGLLRLNFNEVDAIRTAAQTSQYGEYRGLTNSEARASEDA